MKYNGKFIPMIALGLTALLGVGNAGEAVWENRILTLTDSKSTSNEAVVVGNNPLDVFFLNVEIVNPKIIATYNQPISVNGGSLSVVFGYIGTSLKLNNSLTINNGKVDIFLGTNPDNSGGNSVFSASQGVALNGGALNVDVRNSTSSDFNSDITFNGGEADFVFRNSNIRAFAYSPSFANRLFFNTSSNSGKATFNFEGSTNIAFWFVEGGKSIVSNTKPNEDVLLNFKGSNNNISFYDFTNMKIVFNAGSSDNVFVRKTYNSSTNHPIRWIENYGKNNTIIAFPSFTSISPLDPITIENIKGGSSVDTLNFVLGVNTHLSQVTANKLTIKAGSGAYNFGVYLLGSNDFQSENGLLIASAVNDVTLNPIDGYVSGFVLSKIEYDKKQNTDENGNGDSGNYTSYFLTSAKNVGVAPVNQSITSSALALNYDLFIGNFNSLNKRMGELRDNPYSEGMWGRIFNGQISNDFSGSKNNYTTIQMGYDHKLGDLSDASNYLGFSVSYLLGLSDQHSIDASSSYLSRSIKDVISNGVEIALYNSYIQDNGWFSDTIAKFSYLTSDFNILDNSNNTSEKENTSNIAFTLSQEFGYRFKLGETQSWYIDPQAELALGYFSGTDLKQVAGSDYLDAKSDSMLLFRARVGTAVGYDFKDLTSSKDFNAKLYVGLSYEADFVSGGDVTLTPNNGSATKIGSLFGSDGRGVLNVGTNLEIKEQTRLYADIQTSFGGKITNDYQVNFGVRYSFGEGVGKETPKPNSF